MQIIAFAAYCGASLYNAVLLYNNLCRTDCLAAFDADDVVAFIKVGKAEAPGTVYGFDERFHQMPSQIEHLHANHRRCRLCYRQFVIRKAESEVLHCGNRMEVRLAVRRLRVRRFAARRGLRA